MDNTTFNIPIADTLIPSDNDPSFYDWQNMDYGQSYLRGFYQGYRGHGPFGIWRCLEEDPNEITAMLVSQWLKGWSKGRKLYMETHHEN